MHETGLVLAGIIISSVAMAIGIGGGILWTPILIFIYKLSPQEAITTSLLIQVAGLGSGTSAYLKARLVEKKLSIIFFLVALPGVIIGSFFTINLSQQTVQMSLGVMAMMLALLFVYSSEEFDNQEENQYRQTQLVRVLPIPAFFGFIMGFLSLGIGEWLIPALRHRLRLKMARAIGTVIPMMFLLAIVAAGIHYLLTKTLHLNYLLWGALGTLIGGQIGALFPQHINERLLKQTFIYLMTLIGIHMIFQSI